MQFAATSECMNKMARLMHTFKCFSIVLKEGLLLSGE